MAVTNGPGSLAWGDGESSQAAVVSHEGLVGDGSSQRPRLTSPGGRGGLPRRRSVLMKGMQGTAVTNGPGSPTWGTGSPAQAAVVSHEGPVGDGSSQRPGLTSMGGRGVLPRRRSVLMEGL